MFFMYLIVETIFGYYMDAVDNNDFLDVFMYLVGKQYLVDKTIFWFYMDVVDNNDFLHVFHVFGCWKQYLDFTWMYIMMTSFVFFIYLVVENNI